MFKNFMYCLFVFGLLLLFFLKKSSKMFTLPYDCLSETDYVAFVWRVWLRKLKTELQDVKRKGAKRASEKYSQHSCGRCLEPLSRLAVFSSQCKMCNHILCRNCRMVLPDGSWLCNVCAKES